MNTIPVLIGGDTINVSPERITAVLEAKKQENDTIQISCSVQLLLDFILEVQKYAVDTHVANSIDRR